MIDSTGTRAMKHVITGVSSAFYLNYLSNLYFLFFLKPVCLFNG